MVHMVVVYGLSSATIFLAKKLEKAKQKLAGSVGMEKGTSTPGCCKPPKRRFSALHLLRSQTALGDLHLHHLPKRRHEHLGPSHGHQRIGAIGVKALEMTTLRSLRHQGGDVFTQHLENLR